MGHPAGAFRSYILAGLGRRAGDHAFTITELPVIWASLARLLLSFGFFSLVGSLIQPYGLVADIAIPAPLEKDAATKAADLDNVRADILDHAYGFVSRDNRAGGLKHVLDWIDKDPDPVAAWACCGMGLVL
jgi:hypothetical protein